MYRISIWRTIAASTALLALLLGETSVAREKPYEETAEKTGWHLFVRAKKKNPHQQLEYAAQLLEAGKTKAAMRQYLALTISWPDSMQAPAAQYQYARLLDKRGSHHKAFDEYQRLFDRYVGLFPYEEVLNRQFEIARTIMQQKKGKFLFFDGFSAPERAIPLFETILTNAPQWTKAAEAQYLIGQAHEKSLAYEEAIRAYSATQNRYPESPFAEQAAFGSARCAYLLAQESPQNEQLLEAAWGQVTLCLNSYPDGEDAATAREYQKTLLRQRAKIAYDRGHYYDKIAKEPKAALIAYETMVKQFPNSEFSDSARARIEELSRKVEKRNED